MNVLEVAPGAGLGVGVQVDEDDPQLVTGQIIGGRTDLGEHPVA
ncbi:hypothetical protein [Mycobacterium sp. NPDC050853]